MLPKLLDLTVIHPLKTAGILVIVGLIIMLSALSRVIGDRKRGGLYLTLGGGALILLGTMGIPKIFNLETITLPINSYGFTIMIGFLLAIGIATRRAKPLGINTDIILDLGIIAMIFGIMGAKINYVLQYSQFFQAAPGKYRVFDLADNGYNWMGVLLGTIPYLIWWWRKKSDEKIRLYSWQSGSLILLTLFFAFVGCRALYLWQNSGDYDWKVFESWQSGFVWYGGMIGGISAVYLYLVMRKQNVGLLGDILSPSLMLGLAFGRIGCFLNGCCYGNPTDSFVGIKYPKSPVGSDSVTDIWRTQLQQGKIPQDSTWTLPIHATQLYETIACIGIFFLTSLYWKKWKKNNGETIFLMVILYGIWRFTVEFLRGDPGRETFGAGNFSYSQTIAILMVIASSIGFFYLRRKTETPPPEEPKAETN
ncbi:MAG: prolipoprotein diacylglyceryl transferase [Planctomycetota bacterium]|nr:prolipoprotein diacylglyceryl transferase [Planctomycetota bacterium]